MFYRSFHFIVVKSLRNQGVTVVALGSDGTASNKKHLDATKTKLLREGQVESSFFVFIVCNLCDGPSS